MNKFNVKLNSNKIHRFKGKQIMEGVHLLCFVLYVCNIINTFKTIIFIPK